jgi:hypothetical protein
LVQALLLCDYLLTSVSASDGICVREASAMKCKSILTAVMGTALLLTAAGCAKDAAADVEANVKAGVEPDQNPARVRSMEAHPKASFAPAPPPPGH